MKKFVLGLAVLPFLAGVSLAGQPQPLTDQQMDKVAAGFNFSGLDISQDSVTLSIVNGPLAGPCSNCFLAITGTPLGDGAQTLQIFAIFGQ
ncbi:MAG TPA: hypothetical protein VLX09_02905 [Stellaceae bacterium]|nr:hypothetical protein [Stellaceae bacterium]